MDKRSTMDWSGLSQDEAARARRDEREVRKGFWQKLKANVSYVPFAEEATAAYFAAFDRDTPLRVRATLLAALAYFILPFDFMPDFLPLLGFSDDAAVLMGAVRLLTDQIKPHHRAAAREALHDVRLRTEPAPQPSAGRG